MHAPHRTSWIASTVFHVGLASALAIPSISWRATVEVRAGRDQADSPAWVISFAAAEPQLLDTPIVVSPDEVHVADRRLFRTPTNVVLEDLHHDLPPIEQATALLHRLRPVNRATSAATAPVPILSSTPPPRRTRSVPASAASAASNPGADTSKPSQSRVIPPVFTEARPPVFPTEALRHGWSGVVLLKITVDERGQVVDAKIAKTSGHAALDAAAVRAVRTWRGRPATRAGVPIRSTWNKPVRFE